jgi:hypothetical protein
MLKPEVYERESKHTRPNLDQRDFRKVKRKLQRLMSRNDQRSTLPALQGFLQSEPSVDYLMTSAGGPREQLAANRLRQQCTHFWNHC